MGEQGIAGKRPVAGEATDTFRNLLLEAVHRYGNARALAEHDIKQRGQISTTVAAILDLLDAAPQASAEDVRNAALPEMVRYDKDDGLAGASWKDGWNDCIRAAENLRALKTQADKDGGQQRAGDVSAEAHNAALLEVERVGVELAGRLHEAAMSLETISQIAGRPGKDIRPAAGS